MKEAGERNQVICCQMIVGKLQSNLDSARTAKADTIRVTFTESELLEITAVMGVLGAVMETAPAKEARYMAESCSRLAGKLQNARCSAREHERKVEKKAATKAARATGDGFAGKAVA